MTPCAVGHNSRGLESALGQLPRNPCGSGVRLWRDAVPLDLPVERLGVDAEQRRGLAAMAADLAQRGDDVLALHVLDAARRAGGGARAAPELVGQVRGLDLVVRGKDHGALDRVL